MASRWLDETLTPLPNLGQAHPFTVAELDEHVDAGRIWATIFEARTEMEYERGRLKAESEAEEEVLFEDYRDKVTAALDKLKASYTNANLAALEQTIAGE